jgi:nucleoside-diphosphate-sugar epimerase
MNILITGAAGFIGHQLLYKLDNQGHFVQGVDNFTDYGIIPQEELKTLHEARMCGMIPGRIDKVDIRDYDALKSSFGKYDLVIHCAAFPRAKVVDQNPQEGCSVLTHGLINVLRCCEEFNVGKFVYVSSSMVYGDFSLYGYEDMKCNPKGVYGILKLAGESITRDHCRRTGMEYTIVRPSAVYGPRDVEDRVVSKFLIAAMRGEELRVCGADESLDFTYLDDCVDGIARAATSDRANGNIYNITRGSSRTLLEAAEVAVSVAGGGKIVVGEANPRYPSRGTLSNIRAGEDFGYKGKIDIEEGFKKYREWLVHYPVLWRR